MAQLLSVITLNSACMLVLNNTSRYYCAASKIQVFISGFGEVWKDILVGTCKIQVRNIKCICVQFS